MPHLRTLQQSQSFEQVRELKPDQNISSLAAKLANNGLDEVVLEANGKNYLAVGESIHLSGLQGNATVQISLNGENIDAKVIATQDDITSSSEGWSKGTSFGDSVSKAWTGLKSSPNWDTIHTVSTHVGRWPTVVAPPVVSPPQDPDVIDAPETDPVAEIKPAVEVFFTKNGQNLDQELAKFILSADTSVDVAAFELDCPAIRDAILQAHQNGLKVRVVTDSNYKDEHDIKALQAAGIEVIDDQRSGLMHNKFVVLDRGQDDAALWTGSMNMTDNGVNKNNNNAQIFRSPQLAENYGVEFDEMFVDHSFGRTSPNTVPYPSVTVGHSRVETYFAAEGNVAGKVAEALSGAQTSIHFMAFSFTHKAIGQVVIDKLAAGKTVSGVFDNTQAGSKYSKYHELKALGADVKRDGNPKLLHHKVFIIDEKTVITGSFNFSESADKSNDENLLIIEDPEIAEQYLQEFKKVYAETANNPKNDE